MTVQPGQGFSVARGTASRMISGGPVVLLVRSAHDEAADRAWAAVIAQLEGMQSGPDPDEPSTGPGNVLDPVPLSDGWLFTFDPGFMTGKELREVPEMVLEQFRAAGSAGAQILAPGPNRWIRSLEREGTGSIAQVLLVGAERTYPGQGRPSLAWSAEDLQPWLVAATDWLTDLREGPVGLQMRGAVIGESLEPEQARSAALLPLTTGSSCYLWVHRPKRSSRLVYINTILGIELMAIEVPQDPGSPDTLVPALEAATAYWSRLAPHCLSAAADFQINTDPDDRLNPTYLGDLATDNDTFLPRPLPLGEYARWVRGPHWWQILTPNHLQHLGKLKTGVMTPLEGDRVAVTFGKAADWWPGTTTRPRLRKTVAAELDLLIPPLN